MLPNCYEFKEANMEVSLVSFSSCGADAIKLAASKCYGSKPSLKAVVRCAESGHMAIFDHVSFTFDVSGISRACLAQLTRYRVGTGYTVRSQRYCDEAEAAFVVPPVIKSNTTALRHYKGYIEAAVNAYSVLKAFAPREDARYLLPNACSTFLVMTVDATALIHICNQRLCERAQWEIRELVTRMAKLAGEAVPELARYLVPNCERLGYCPETGHGCGMRSTLEELLNEKECSGYLEGLAESEAEDK